MDNVLVLVSFGLVLLATILLVVGLLTDDGLNLIYLSIGCSFVAAVVLYLAFRRARPKVETASEPPAPLLPEGSEPADFADQAPAPERARPSPAPPRGDDATTIQPAVPEPEPEEAVNPGATPTADPEPAVATASGGDDWVDDDDWADAGEFEVEFPIADYDELTVAEIMPLLPQLYSDEIEVVAERERGGKNRTTILARLAELAATGTEADVSDDEPAPAVPAPAVEETVEVDADVVAEGADEAFAPERVPARPAPRVPSLADDDWDDDEVFPIADYDELTADQIIPLLSQLEDDELDDVKAREVAGQGRKSVITEIDRQLGLVGVVDDEDRTDEPAAAPAPRVQRPEDSLLAISGYDGLTVAEIRPLLAGLSAGELRAVLEHEVARDNRRTIVSDIERRLESMAEEAPAPAATPTRRAPRKAAAPARKAATKRSGAANAPVKRAAKKAIANHRFPIANYDELSVADIRPRLGGLTDRQLRQVREREVAGAGRKTIIADIDRRLR